MNKKGLTLVELIVVITILAILWTITFTSLQQYQNNSWEFNITINYDWYVYRTNDYYEKNWCIEFIDISDRKITACWEYLIKEY